jgi:prepilin-type processing-associated H-X9-DG protein
MATIQIRSALRFARLPQMPIAILLAESWSFGSAHSSVFNMAFADASVRQIGYDIDIEIFNRLGNREDGEVIDFDKL